MKLSDYVVEFIKGNGVDKIFGYQGGAITHLVDSIYKAKDIDFISLFHEQSAAFAAEGYSRVSGNIGVAIATSGPGATNLITGIGSCFFDSIPCLFITGQVNTYEFRRRDNIRQEGFQETDIQKIVESITKYSVMVNDANDIKYHLEKAVHLAKTGRGGPVLVDIPMDLQRTEIYPDKLRGYFESSEYNEEIKCFEIDEDIDNVIELIKNSKRPVIHAGGGIRLANATKELKKLVEATSIPVVTSLMGLDSIEHNHPKYAGYMGTYGTRYANLAVANCDLLIVLGARLTSRQTSPNVKSFAREAKIVHVDIDENELNLKLKEDISVKCDLRIFINKLISKLKIDGFDGNYNTWMTKINSYKEQYPTYPTQKKENKIDPNEIMHLIGEMCGENTIFSLDIGQNQMWASQSISIKKNQRILNAGGMGPMGFSLPAAIGACYSDRNLKVISIVGDGGFQMNIQELQTIVRDKLPIKIIVMNNHVLGMIRHFQELYFDSNYYGTIEGYDSPDFVKVCTAYGVDSHRITTLEELGKVNELLNDSDSHLIEVDLSNITYVIPKLEMGKPIEEQSPLVDREELSKNMIIDIYNK
ncbi:biosynthetic-type acetolactate synthase large subunit [Clostridium gasigenes]|uniref:biosynthetic-type acetolactate synthase large subunit n=1 Tax=Clostridium gasigenes TaxID=94869 RepID=UPI0016264AF1|nr:biosynthetic-type acetolactate synthase large subunit [Clostridium gasigenes]MBB6624102.1 biosynthetic-type acetolactate synthase large subunit [Clostridium gasigenes]